MENSTLTFNIGNKISNVSLSLSEQIKFIIQNNSLPCNHFLNLDNGMTIWLETDEYNELFEEINTNINIYGKPEDLDDAFDDIINPIFGDLLKTFEEHDDIVRNDIPLNKFNDLQDMIDIVEKYSTPSEEDTVCDDDIHPVLYWMKNNLRQIGVDELHVGVFLQVLNPEDKNIMNSQFQLIFPNEFLELDSNSVDEIEQKVQEITGISQPITSIERRYLYVKNSKLKSSKKPKKNSILSWLVS